MKQRVVLPVEFGLVDLSLYLGVVSFIFLLLLLPLYKNTHTQALALLTPSVDQPLPPVFLSEYTSKKYCHEESLLRFPHLSHFFLPLPLYLCLHQSLGRG